MGQITTQLGHLFALTIPTVIFVIFLLVVLDRLFFKPLSQTLDERVRATSGALAEARIQGAKAEEKFREYERAVQAARQEIYRQREEARNKSLNERDKRIQQARGHAESMVKDAQTDLEKETAATKVEMRVAVESLATEMTVSLFAPHLAPGEQGGAQA